MPKKEQVKVLEHKFKPTIRFTDKDLPELKDWKVGEKYRFTVEAKLIEQEIPRDSSPFANEEGFDKDEVKGMFEVLKIKNSK